MNKKYLSVLLIFLVLFTLPVFAKGNKEESKESVIDVVETSVAPVEKTVATVKLGDLSVDIKNTDVTAYADSYKENNITLTDAQALEALIDEYLVAFKLENMKYELTDELAVNLVVYYLQNTLGVEIKTQEQLDSIISNYQIDVSALASSLARSYFMNVYLSENYSDILNQDVTPSDEDINTLYELNQSQFTNSQKVKIAHIFFKIDESNAEDAAKAEAESVYNLISTYKTTFEQAVSDYSDDLDTSSDAGTLGWVNSEETAFENEIASLTGNYNMASSKYHKQLFTEDTYNQIIAMKAGEISKPLKSTAGYHIFKALICRESKNLGINDPVYPESNITVKDYLIYRYEAQKESVLQTEAAERMLSDLRAEAEIKYY